MSDFLSGARAGLGLYSGYQSARAQSRAKYGAELDEAEARMASQMELLAANFGDGKGGIDPAKVRASDASFQQYGALLKDLANNPHLRNRILPKGYEFENAVPVGEGKFAISLRNSETGESGIPLSTKGAKGGDDVVVHTPDSLIALGNELYHTIGARGVNAARSADQLSAANATLISGDAAPDTADGELPAYMDYADKVYGPVRQALRGGIAGQVPVAPGIPADIRPKPTGSKAPGEPVALGQSVDYAAFQKKMAASESSGNYGAEFKDSKDRRFVGKYQIGQLRLTDGIRAGVVPEGTTLDDLKANPELQDTFAAWHFRDYGDRLAKEGLSGKAKHPETGEPLSDEALIAAAQIGGWSGMKKWLRGGYDPEDQLGTSISDYAERFNTRRASGDAWQDAFSGERIGANPAIMNAPQAEALSSREVGQKLGEAALFGANIASPVYHLDQGGRYVGGKIAEAYDAAKPALSEVAEGAKGFKDGLFGTGGKTGSEAVEAVQSAPAADVASLPPEQKQEVARGAYLHFEKEAQAVADGAAPKTNTKPALARAMRPDAAVKDINRVLGNMVSLGYLTPQQAVAQSLTMQNAAATTRASMVKDYAAAAKSTAETRSDNAESASKGVLELAKGTALSFFRTNEKGVVQSILGGADLGKMKTEEQAILLVANMKESLPRVTTLSQQQQQRMMLVLNGSVPITPADEFLFTHALKEMAKHVSQEQRFSTKGAGSVALDQEYNAAMR